ncbi:hypothetical protein [Halomarina rubra]|uniref:Uncharacterized protein n=1 Tax=Halomarina rubra TaxID=2071873 RepID=A0ABD6AUU3_9EURY|nr:hypothetical protein [Halomarina rubra]
MQAVTLLTTLTLLLVLFARADRRFDRRLLGVCIAAFAGVLLVTSVPGVPHAVVVAVTLVGVGSLVAASLGVVVDRYLARNERIA